MDRQASVIDLSTRNVVATTPLHAGAGTILSVAVVGNGKRAAGLFANDPRRNLDPLAGPLGAELYFGNPFPPGPTVSQLVPAPDGDGLLAGCQDCDLLFKVEPTVAPPGVEPASVGQTLARLARSADGRRLWVAERDTTAGMGGLRMFGLGEAMAMDLVSGAGQSARPGEALPLPVQVRLRDASGRPQVGVVVTFVLQGADPGTLDGLAGRTLRRITDVSGQAGVRWTLGGTPGPAGLQVFALGIADSLPVGAEVVATDAGIVPQVVRFGPTDSATDINAGTAVFARFNQRMNAASVSARMSVCLPSGPVPGTFRFEEEGRVAIFQPERALAFSAPCTLRVLAGTTDLDGQGTLADAASAFTTEPPPPVSLQAIGPPAAAAGATVVLEGEGFSPIAAQNVVIFNGKIAPVARAATTSLVTHVPIGAVSGKVRVIVGASTSNELEFEVLVPTPAPGESLATIPAAKAVSDIAITPDGSRAYVTSPPTNSVSVMDIRGARIVTTISVGLQPQGIAILPDGTRAYVANTGSDDLSIIDTDPSSPTFNSVVGRVPVGDGPVDLVTSAVGPRVYVANSGSGTVSIIDANPYNGTFDQVVKTVNTGSGTTSVIVLPDATRLYAGTTSSVVMVDLGSLVVTTVNTGSGTTSIILTPDATLLLALLDDAVDRIDAVPEAPHNQVVTTVNTGWVRRRSSSRLMRPSPTSRWRRQLRARVSDRSQLGSAGDDIAGGRRHPEAGRRHPRGRRTGRYRGGSEPQSVRARR
jgi:YVTN family beta-propeller protein